MMNKKQLKEAKKQEAKKELKEMFNQYGHTVYTELDHVSKSGMLRKISCYVQDEKGFRNEITDLVAEVTSFNQDNKTGALRVTGCGMDMGFHVVYSLSNNLYNEEGYTREGAYKLNQRWL